MLLKIKQRNENGIQIKKYVFYLERSKKHSNKKKPTWKSCGKAQLNFNELLDNASVGLPGDRII